KPRDEIIMPSFTFVSTANAFALRGAKISFVDIRPDTMNIDETKIEPAITKRTKAIVVVHYAGISCEMDKIMDIAQKYNLFVIEDAAHAINAKYKGRQLGTIGNIGTLSFHDTKNISCGEGGAILINNEEFIKRAEIIREKGTNRSQFLRGEIDKYTWQDIGSSYLPSELNAAVLLAQFQKLTLIQSKRVKIWNKYYNNLLELEYKGLIELPKLPKESEHNAHIFYIKVKNLKERTKMISYLNSFSIKSTSHYVPLHKSKAGIKYGKFIGKDIYTTKESERLLRLPLFTELTNKEVEFICQKIYDFYK
ncbi:MAG: dTDP-4-amino-4,6-dideoxygalactose transaminase, partial [Candidatus Calescibacterium sp.]|nr:dTDP-4-amino-4,6-dideoxygalactose transaminase [Candidatus Calescibacterium sp.]